MDNMNTLGIISILVIISILTGGTVLFSEVFLIAAIALLGCLVLYHFLLKNFQFWQCNIIILIAGYFMLSRGFSYVGIRLGSIYLFIGEIVIFLSLISFRRGSAIAKLASNAVSKWIFAWILLGCILAMTNLSQHRPVSIARDFAMVYYSIFLLFGYAFYKDYKNIEIFYKIIGWIFVFHAIWGLFYIARETVAANSPLLMGFMPLFSFREDADSLIFLGGALYFLLMVKHHNWNKLLVVLSVIIQFFLILLFQSRAVYVSCFLVFMFLSMTSTKKVLFKIMIVLMLIFAAGVVSNFTIKGEEDHYDMSAEGTVQEFLSIFTPDESQTASYRLVWWRFVIEDALENPRSLLLGKGFGPSLAINRYSLMVGEWTREYEEVGGIAKSPHNFFITVFGRMGIVGLFLWLAINCAFFLHMLKGIRLSRILGEHKIHNILIWIGCFILAIIAASFFAVLLESPFMAIPYFFFMGLGLAIVDRLTVDYNRIETRKGTV